MEAWLSLSQKFVNANNSYQLICFYCNQLMNDKNINQKCNQNVEYSITKDFMINCVNRPPNEYHGNHQHYFVKPLSKFRESVNLINGSWISGMSELKDYRSASALAKQYMQWAQIDVLRVRTVSKLNAIDIIEQFKSYDPDNTGYIKAI